MLTHHPFAAAILLCGVLSMMAHAQPVKTVSSPPAGRGALYTSNREPLLASPLVKLPIGSIVPKGWLRHQLELERDGMIGHLSEISQWCKYEGNAWVAPEGKGHSGWEELPYWLKGYGDLGYVLRDENIIKETKRWIDATIATQREDGYFGPRSSLTSLQGKPDFWPNMLMLNVMQSWYEFNGDERVIPFMSRYFKWQMSVPEKDFLVGYWPNIRGGDNLESIYWLYNRTGEKWLLELAEKVHRRTANWTSGVINWHGVNVSQGFREPGIFYMQSGDEKFLHAAEHNYATVMERYGQMPGGMFGADENARKGYDDPRQGAETCSMVEFMHSFEMLTKITGNPIWADRCEDVAFNSLPAAMTPDQKALHYLTCANMVQLDKNNKAPGVENSGTMFSYSPFAVYRCCQHNVSHGWPYYAEELWLATSDKGLCASLYAASEVTAKVGDGTTVKIEETTNYPFSDQITLKIGVEKPTQFPLYLRIPGWCESSSMKINGQSVAIDGKPLSFIVIDRQWVAGDTIALQLPMRISARTWEKNKNAVSIDYGPLTFSLKIDEKWSRYGGSDKWPEQEVHATTPWNYGIIFDEKNPAGSFEVIKKEGPLATQPFTPDTAPIALRAKAKRIPNWKQESTGLIARIQQSPVRSTEPTETVTLIPMGAARLRIASFPTIGDGPNAHDWPLPPRLPTASHVFASDTVEALNDGKLPANSNDQTIPRLTFWDHKGTQEWVQYDFETPRELKAADVYWFDDAGTGLCRVPQSWQLLYKDGGEWKPVKAADSYEVKKDQFNKVSFDPVRTSAIRLQVQLQPTFSAGILEWRVE
jgi:hypothetical protein